ncbi:MAG: HlyD family efflux transporter periplasmic adaptor subunit [Woeseiaceae bacterium]|nr:HlyD family efflux transporter periplasmic adaptor subunit [Woeseiaceae bacterium]
MQAHDYGRSGMRQDDSKDTGALALFRRQATAPAHRRAFGSVSVIVPPSGTVALVVALLAVLCIGAVACFIEVPQAATAVGLLMPPGGMANVVARRPGRIAGVHVRVGQTISPGDALLDVVADVDDFSVHQTRLLHMERLLLEQAHSRALDVEQTRLNAVDEQMAWLAQRRAVTEDEYDLQYEQVRLFERRLARRRELAVDGVVSADRLDQEQAQWIAARTRLAAMHRSILEIEQRLGTLRIERQQLADDAALRVAEYDIERNRFEARLSEHAHRMDRTIRASEPAIVAKVDASAGATVNPGDILVRLYRPYRTLEAWLYLPNARSGFLNKGQVVKLRFDAYPHEVFGTTNATVTSVSRVPVVPWELKVPLQLNEPMFEIRASISRASIDALETTWPLRPGISFKADVIQRRYKLYQWILRRITGDGRSA